MKKINYKGLLIAQVILFVLMFLVEIVLAFAFLKVFKAIMMIPSGVFDNKILFISIVLCFLFLIFLIKFIPKALEICLDDIIDTYKKIK